MYNVSLSDSGEFTKLSNHCSLSIIIKDFNAHAPKFVFPNEKNSSLRIKEYFSNGSHLFQVKAFDPDNVNKGKVTYEIDQKRTLNNDWKSFGIDRNTGDLSLNTKLNINRQSVYLVS